MTLTQWLITGTCGLLLTATGASALGPGVRGRQHNQQARIAQGLRTGQLTAREARRLENRQRRIHRSIVRDRRDGGVFTSRERAKAQRRLNQQNRAIRRQRHDSQVR